MGKEIRLREGITYLMGYCVLSYQRVELFFVPKGGESKGHIDRQADRKVDKQTKFRENGTD